MKHELSILIPVFNTVCVQLVSNIRQQALDAGITFGVYYQLTPRYGHTRAQLKKLARKLMADQQQQKQ